jgi:hypothetical protein
MFPVLLCIHCTRFSKQFARFTPVFSIYFQRLFTGPTSCKGQVASGFWKLQTASAIPQHLSSVSAYLYNLKTSLACIAYAIWVQIRDFLDPLKFRVFSRLFCRLHINQHSLKPIEPANQNEKTLFNSSALTKLIPFHHDAHLQSIN